MSEAVIDKSDTPAIPIRLVRPVDAEAALAALAPSLKAQAELGKFAGKPGQVAALVGESGVELVLAGLGAAG